MYQFDKTDATYLEEHPPYFGKCWEESGYDRVKKNLKKFLCRRQSRFCIYCKTELEVACHGEHIEHIVHKDFRPIWMFEPFNLGISCSQCNTQKGVEHTLTEPAKNMVILPLGGIFYRIIHPHFDDYDLHIEFEDGLFVKAKNDYKGHNTIEMCKLWRSIYADRRARALSISQSDRYTIWLARIQRTDIPQHEIDDFIIAVNELADMLTG